MPRSRSPHRSSRSRSRSRAARSSRTLEESRRAVAGFGVPGRLRSLGRCCPWPNWSPAAAARCRSAGDGPAVDRRPGFAGPPRGVLRRHRGRRGAGARRPTATGSASCTFQPPPVRGRSARNGALLTVAFRREWRRVTSDRGRRGRGVGAARGDDLVSRGDARAASPEGLTPGTPAPEFELPGPAGNKSVRSIPCGPPGSQSCWCSATRAAVPAPPWPPRWPAGSDLAGEVHRRGDRERGRRSRSGRPRRARGASPSSCSASRVDRSLRRPGNPDRGPDRARRRDRGSVAAGSVQNQSRRRRRRRRPRSAHAASAPRTRCPASPARASGAGRRRLGGDERCPRPAAAGDGRDPVKLRRRAEPCEDVFDCPDHRSMRCRDGRCVCEEGSTRCDRGGHGPQVLRPAGAQGPLRGAATTRVRAPTSTSAARAYAGSSAKPDAGAATRARLVTETRSARTRVSAFGCFPCSYHGQRRCGPVCADPNVHRCCGGRLYRTGPPAGEWVCCGPARNRRFVNVMESERNCGRCDRRCPPDEFYSAAGPDELPHGAEEVGTTCIHRVRIHATAAGAAASSARGRSTPGTATKSATSTATPAAPVAARTPASTMTTAAVRHQVQAQRVLPGSASAPVRRAKPAERYRQRPPAFAHARMRSTGRTFP